MSKTKIAQILSGRIWALTPSKLEEVSLFVEALVDGRAPGWPSAAADAQGIETAASPAGPSYARYTADPKTGVAVIRIEGVIERRANMVGAFSGGTSTQMLAQSIVDAAADEDVTAIVLDIDSPGGSALAPSEVAAAIAKARQTVPVVAWTGGQMCSAAYWIGAACDSIVAMDTSVVGSIGVALVHYDRSAKDAKDGVTRTVLSAGTYKRIASDEKALSDEGREYLQGQVDAYYTKFVDAVASGRGVTVETVLERMADGRIFIGAEALQAGLVDHIGTFESALEIAREKRRSTMTKTSDAKASQLSGVTLEDLTQSRPDLIQEATASATAQAKAEAKTAVATATADERARVVEILETGGDPAVLLTAVKDGTPAAGVYKLLYQARQTAQDQAKADLDKSLDDNAGASGVNKADRDAPDALTKEAQLAAKTKAHMAANPGVAFDAALKAVMAANPDLAQA
jgi:signal peptide peptidase SppA